jgi:nucleotide-binding universal stress UspA family protein
MNDRLIVCGVDRSASGPRVVAAAKVTGAPMLLVHAAMWVFEVVVPAFEADGGETERLVCHGPPGASVLRVAGQREAAMIVLGTRARRWPSVARYVVERASRPVLVVGPRADPCAPVVLSECFDRRLMRDSPAPVLIAPQR